MDATTLAFIDPLTGLNVATLLKMDAAVRKLQRRDGINRANPAADALRALCFKRIDGVWVDRA